MKNCRIGIFFHEDQFAHGPGSQKWPKTQKNKILWKISISMKSEVDAPDTKGRALYDARY